MNFSEPGFFTLAEQNLCFVYVALESHFPVRWRYQDFESSALIEFA